LERLLPLPKRRDDNAGVQKCWGRGKDAWQGKLNSRKRKIGVQGEKFSEKKGHAALEILASQIRMSEKKKTMRWGGEEYWQKKRPLVTGNGGTAKTESLH